MPGNEAAAASSRLYYVERISEWEIEAVQYQLKSICGCAQPVAETKDASGNEWHRGLAKPDTDGVGALA